MAKMTKPLVAIKRTDGMWIVSRDGTYSRIPNILKGVYTGKAKAEAAINLYEAQKDGKRKN